MKNKNKLQLQAYHGTSPDNRGILLYKEPYWHTLDPIIFNGNHFIIWNCKNRKLLAWTGVEDGRNLATKQSLINILCISNNFKIKKKILKNQGKKLYRDRDRDKEFVNFNYCNLYWIPSNREKINKWSWWFQATLLCTTCNVVIFLCIFINDKFNGNSFFLGIKQWLSHKTKTRTIQKQVWK